MQPSASIVYDSTKILAGVIEGSSVVENRVAYRVFLEGYHTPKTNPTIRSIGTHVAQSGSGRYKKGTRVLCLIRNNDYDSCFVIGTIGDPFSKKVKQADPAIFNEGNTRIGTDKSGFFSGESSSVSFVGQNAISLTDKDVSFSISKYRSSISKAGLLFQSDAGSITLSSERSAFYSEKDLYLLSKNGMIDMSASYIHLSPNGGKVLFDKISDIKIAAGKTFITSGYVKIVGSSALAYSEGSSAIDINSEEGDIALNVGAGDLPITLVDPTATFSIDVGYPVTSCYLEMSEGVIEFGNLSASMIIGATFGITLKNSLGTMELKPSGSIAISNTVGGSITITPAGMIEIEGVISSLEKTVLGETLVGLIEDLITELTSATVVTAFGPYPFSPTVIGNLNKIKGQMQTTLSKSVKIG